MKKFRKDIGRSERCNDYRIWINLFLSYLIKPTICLLCFLLCDSIFSESRLFASGKYHENLAYTTRHLTDYHGFPSNTITSVIKDKDGFIWLGTTNGLCRWDGMSARVFKNDITDSTTIMGNHVSRDAMVLNEKGDKLIIGFYDGLSIFDLQTKQSRNYQVNPSQQRCLPAPVNCVFSDRQGQIWVGTDKGFSRFDLLTQDFTNYSCQNSMPSHVFLDGNNRNVIHDIAQDLNNDSIIWVASLAGLLKFNKYSEKINWFFYPDADYERELNQFNIIVPGLSGNLFIGTWNFDMVVFNTEREKFIKRYGTSGVNDIAHQSRLVPYSISCDGKVWVSSANGLGLLDPQSDEISLIKSFENEKGYSFAPELYFTDDGGQLWLGSGNGVYILIPENQNVRNYFVEPLDEEHWYLTLSLFEDTINKEILIGYGRGEGLHSFNRNHEKFGVKPYERRVISEYNLVQILPLQNGEILLLTMDELYLYKDNGRFIQPLMIPYNHFPGFTDIKQDAEGRIWITSANMGLQQYNFTSNTMINIHDWNTCFTTGHQLPMFSEMHIDHYNRIWFRRRGESYGYFDPKNDTVVYFDSIESKFDLTCFGDIKNDTLWVATASNGIGYIDLRDTDKGVQISDINDVMDIGVTGDMIVDSNGILWCLTYKGLWRVNTSKNEAILYDNNYGIPLLDNWSGKDALVPGQLRFLSDGKIVIGYRRGLGFFHPDSLYFQYPTPQPYFSSVQLLGEETYINDNGKLKIPYRKNYLSLHYSALDLYFEGLAFRHKMEGVDPDWIENERLSEVFYSNLQPGNYKFIVQVRSRSGLGATKQRELQISVLPPWWRTLWAFLLFLSTILAITYFIYRFQVNRQLAIKETRRLHELDDMRTRLYTNITHEFRTPVTLILGLADELKLSLDGKRERHYLNKLDVIHRSGNELLKLVNQLLDLAKLKHGNMTFSPLIFDIIPWLHYVVESHQSLARSKNIHLSFETQLNTLEMNFDPDQLIKVFSNLIINAIKFTQNRGEVACHVHFESASRRLLITILDNGIGIPVEEQQNIFHRFYQVQSEKNPLQSGTGIGLSLAKEILEQMGGEIRVKSAPQKGSEFVVVLPVENTGKDASGVTQTPVQQVIASFNSGHSEVEYNTTDFSVNSQVPLVLLAEDNQDVAFYIKEIISEKYQVKWTSDGEKAVQLAFDMIPDLVITDIMMPLKNGFDVCNILKKDERTSHIPVIMLTARVTDTDRISGLEKGADAFLTKPFNRKELLVRIEQLLLLRKKLQKKFMKLDFDSDLQKLPFAQEQFLIKTIRLVEKNMECSSFTAHDLANEVNLSESQLYRKLKAVSGKSTAVFIRFIRLKNARKLLERTSMTISEIAYQVGFNDPAWFSRAFKDEFGISPTQAKGKTIR